jgi:N,N'-diacetylbacillosaminyl-diphospho-undecaprenol alpha-1,3-N-acetylgalactosaminyltransferase
MMQKYNLAFFNYLPLEYGGGTAKYFIDTSIALKKLYPKLDISIVTFNENFSGLLINLYSLYFLRNIRNDFPKRGSSPKIDLGRYKIKYIKVKGVGDLKTILGNQNVIYCKNDILETFILKFLVGHRSLSKVILGFHTPIKYDNTILFHSKFHNVIYTSPFYRFLIKDATKLHVLNSYDLKKLKALFPSKIIIKIPNPFDFNTYVSYVKKYKYKLDIPSDKYKIIWVGRLNREKGADDLIKIIKSVNSNYSGKVSWIIVGVGEYHNKFKSLQNTYNNINLLGYVENHYLPSIYKRCDLFLSTSKFESFPYTFLEAQGFGIPVISYNIHGCNEIIKNNKNGFIVDNPDNMSRKIKLLINNNTFKRSDIKNGIRSKLNRNKIYKELHTLLTSF